MAEPSHNNFLVVDLDGTLLNSDILHETFWNAFAKDWTVLFKTISRFFSGKAELKDYLNKISNIDINSLPYNTKIIEYIEQFRSQGGRTALVTASNETIAKEIADHLGIFDETHGSSSKHNLKGKNKAAFLEERFGKNKFYYIGDSYSDLPVWEVAQKAITFNANEKLRFLCSQINKNCEHLSDNISKPQTYIYFKELRVHQWIKNILIFLPMTAAHQFGYYELLSGIIAFFAFSLIASSVYVTNDLLDLSTDRAHLRKRKRPFAMGQIPIQQGLLIAPALLLFGLLVAFIVDIKFFLVLLVYYCITTAYSLYLKRKPIVDIFTLASLYTIRIVAGGIATETEFTFWLLSFSITLFLSLAAVKRQAELIEAKNQDNRYIKKRGYSVDDLLIVTSIAINSGFLSVLILAFYVNSPDVAALYQTPAALWGICGILLFWICRIIYVTNLGQMNDDPIIYAFKNRGSIFCFLLVSMFIMIGMIKLS